MQRRWESKATLNNPQSKYIVAAAKKKLTEKFILVWSKNEKKFNSLRTSYGKQLLAPLLTPTVLPPITTHNDENIFFQFVAVSLQS